MNNIPKAGELWKKRQEDVYYFVNNVSKDTRGWSMVILDQVGENSRVSNWHTTVSWLCATCEKVK